MKKKYKPVQMPKKTKKLNFEKKVVLQSIVSVVLLIYCAVISNVNYFPSHKEFLHKTVNITFGKNDIKDMMNKSKNAYFAVINAGGKYFDIMTALFEVGVDDTKMGMPVSATRLNEPAIYPQPGLNKTDKDEMKTQQEQQPQFRYPAIGEITSKFGSREHPINGENSIHYGVDIAANYGDCVISSLPGTVTDTGFDNNLGNYVKIRHSESMETVYGHLSEIMVKKDEVVDSNTRIGSVGATGAATGPHVHLEVRIDGVCQNPENYLPKN